MPNLHAALPRRLRAAAFTLIFSCLMLSCLTALPSLAEPLVRVAVTHVPAQVATARPLGRMAATPSMRLDFVLPLRNQAQLQDDLARVYDPKDPMYHKYLTSQEFTDAYGPSVADVSAVAAFAKSKGLTLASVSGNRTLLQVTGSSAALEAAFGVNLNDYQGADGRVFFAPDREPVFPASIAGRIIGVAGLDNATVYRPSGHLTPLKPSLAGLPAYAQPLGQEQPQGITGSGKGGFLAPSDITSIYGFPIADVASPGAGQVLAVFELDGYTPSDITAYDNHYFPGQATVPIVNFLVDGFSGAPGSGAFEVTLDLEMMIALCPNAGQILCYEGANDGSSSSIDLYALIATHDLASVVSSSWGGAEFGTSPSSGAMSENQSFMQMAMQGQSMFAASGDAGAFENETTANPKTGAPATFGTLSVQDPSSQPFVTGVGGTLLNDTSTFGYVSESAWGDASDTTSRGLSGAGSGGGISAWWPIPPYQNGFANASNLGSTTQRNVPDVSLFGDFDEGDYSTFFHGGFDGGNGTSAAAPLWAAFTALINQNRASFGLPRVGFLNPFLYTLAANPTSYAANFHDINDGTTNLFYPAVTGYDLATGLGSPQLLAIFNDLSFPPVPQSLTISPSFTTPGQTITATLTLTQPAHSGGVSIPVTIAAPGQAPTPFTTVFIPEGSFTGTFTITTGTNPGTFTLTATLSGVSTSGAFSVIAPPTFSPAFGFVGTVVTIIGADVIGTAVAFNGTPATIVVPVSATEILATVPAGATTGPITLTASDTSLVTGTNFIVVGPPTVTSFAPTSGPVGTSVVVRGTNLMSALVVTFNGIPATFSVFNDSNIFASVPAGATTGPISVRTQGGTGTSTTSFTVIPTPGSLTVSPSTTTPGQTITVTLTLTSPAPAGGVSVPVTIAAQGGSPSAFTTVTIAAGGTSGGFGIVTGGELTTFTLTATLNGVSASGTFTVVGVPTITSISPTSGPVGTVVTVTGTNFTSAMLFEFGGVEVPFSIVSDTTLTATVNANSGSGPITIVTAGGTAVSSQSFTVTIPPPTITSFTPASGPIGTTVVITGTNLFEAEVVGFQNAHATSFTVNSSGTQITATVPTGAITGPIAVLTPGGEAKSSASFTVTAASTKPAITSFSPASGSVGTTVIITGTNLTGASVVGFQNAHATSFTVNSAGTQITTTVPSGAQTGPLAVLTPNGEAKSAASFTVTASTLPTITSFSPTSGPLGTTVVITGTNLTGATVVGFTNAHATSFTVNSAGTQITTTVPTGAVTGPLAVLTPTGEAKSATSFTVTASTKPTITGFTPTSGVAGTTVVITGTNLTGATVVGFMNAHAASFTVNSAGTQITTTVPTGAVTGPLAVLTPNGEAKSSASFTVTP